MLSLEFVCYACYNSFMSTERTHTRHATYEIRYHFVFCPKFRRPVLAGAVGERLAELIPPIIERLGGRVLNLTVQADHVHLFVEIPPTLAPRQVMHRVKGATSHQLRQDFPHLRSQLPSVWARSYYVGTAGRVSAGTIQRYIDEQRGT
jgi:putative transposase